MYDEHRPAGNGHVSRVTGTLLGTYGRHDRYRFCRSPTEQGGAASSRQATDTWIDDLVTHDETGSTIDALARDLRSPRSLEPRDRALHAQQTHPGRT